METTALSPTVLLLLASFLGMIVVLYAAWRIARTVRDSVLLRLPLSPVQVLDLTTAGQVHLHFEGPNRRDVVGKPRLGPAFRDLTWTLEDPATGRALPLRRTTGPRVAGVHWARLGLFRFDMPRPGALRLEIGGLGPHVTVDDCAVVLTRPYTFTLVLWILAIVAGSLLFVGSLVSLTT